MKQEKVVIVYAMIKKSGKEIEGRIALELPEQTLYRIGKQAVNKEELWLYSLVDILAKLQGYEKGRYIRMEDSS